MRQMSAVCESKGRSWDLLRAQRVRNFEDERSVMQDQRIAGMVSIVVYTIVDRRVGWFMSRQ